MWIIVILYVSPLKYTVHNFFCKFRPVLNIVSLCSCKTEQSTVNWVIQSPRSAYIFFRDIFPFYLHLQQAFKASKVMRSTVQVSVPWRSMFGSPSYPSPLDRIRTGRRERAAQFGLNTNADENSFEGNQSYPKIIRSKLKMTDAYDTPKLEKQKLIGKSIYDGADSTLRWSFSDGIVGCTL